MKLIIAGSRYTTAFTEADLARLEEIRPLVTEVVCGMAKGVDTLGKAWAVCHGIPVKRFLASWDRVLVLGEGGGLFRA